MVTVVVITPGNIVPARFHHKKSRKLDSVSKRTLRVVRSCALSDQVVVAGSGEGRDGRKVWGVGVTGGPRWVAAGLLALALLALGGAGAPPPQPRAQRSANLSHFTGTSRKISLYIKNRNLQLLPDGIVNGTSEEDGDYTILQRTTVNLGQIKIQGVATCLYLCMDACGVPYSSKDFTDECVFNEVLEQHHYNTYTSAKHSGVRRTMYLALDARGRPRKVILPAKRPLGKLSGYARVLTRPVHRALLNTCSKKPNPSSTFHAPRQTCRNVKKKKIKCKEGDKTSTICEQNPKRPKKLQQKCENGLCIKEQTVRNITGTMTNHTRHKRPIKNKRLQQNKAVQLGQSEAVVKKKLMKQLKKRRKVGRALGDGHLAVPPRPEVTTPATTPWFNEDESWTSSTSDEALMTSTQVEDVTLWDLTTTSGLEKEFFRTVSAVQETVEDIES